MKSLVLISILAISGCGSLSTLPRSDAAINNHLVNHQTRCNYLPRVYSGVAFDICWLNADYEDKLSDPRAEPNIHDRPRPNNTGDGRGFAMIYVADLIFSTVVDTLALPYTIFKQQSEGSIELE